MNGQPKIPTQIIRQLFIIGVILAIGGLIFSKLLPYLSGLLGALTLYVIMRKSMRILCHKRKWPKPLAAGVLMFLSFICIVVPIGGVIIMLSNKITTISKDFQEVSGPIKDFIGKIESDYNINLSSRMDANAISEWITSHLQEWLGTTFNAFMAILLMYFVLYFMLVNHERFREIVCQYIPMNTKNLQEVGREVRGMVRANAIGIPLVGLAQGIVSLIGFLIFGIEDPIFWFVILSLASMVPFLGTSLGMIPVFLITLTSGDTFAAWAILIYGFVFVGMTDNITRLYFLKRLEDVHPLITLVGVMVGVPLFGFIGLIFGPLLISLFLLIVKIYRRQYGKDSEGTLPERL